MISKKRLLQTGTLSVIFLLSACGGGNQQKADKQSEMPAKHMTMAFDSKGAYCGEVKEEL